MCPGSEMMSGSVVVTGSAGFIGSNLVDSLLAKGHAVVGIDNLRTGSMENLRDAQTHAAFTFYREDICGTRLKKCLPTEIDVLFHLAAVSSVKLSVKDPKYVNRVNVAGTVNLLDAARKRDVRHVVFISSAAVYGNPDKMPVTEGYPLSPVSPYAASKIAGEEYVRSFESTYGIEATVLRYFNVYGPRQQFSEYSGVVSIFVNQALSDRPITVEGDGGQSRSLVFVHDVVRATVLSSQSPTAAGRTMNVAGSRSISILDLARLVKDSVAGSNSQIIHTPPRVGDVRESIGSTELIASVLGFKPEVTLEDGLRRTIDWYRSKRASAETSRSP